MLEKVSSPEPINHFKTNIFELVSKEKKNIGQVGLSWSSSGPDSTPKQAPIRTGDRKTLSMSNLQETKVSLSAIYE